MTLRPAFLIPGLVWYAASALAGPGAGTTPEAPPDKSGYHLFSPTPGALMREMSTDRPDQTESAYTVDAGHVQVELDFFKFTYDQDPSGGGDLRRKTWNFAPTNFKVGLLNNVDVQFVFDSYLVERTRDRQARTTERLDGFGDLTTRLKINLWGDDGGVTALAIMPYVKWPLAESSFRNGETEGGIIIPLAVALPGDWKLGLMTEFDFVHNDDGGYDTEFVNSITLSHDIIGSLAGYVEFFSVAGNAPGFKWQGQADVGFTYAVTGSVQLDFGCNFGVTESAPDFQPFAGISVRF